MFVRGGFMVETFIFIVVFIFALVGVSETVHILTSLVLRPLHSAEKCIVIFLNNECAIEQLAHLFNELNWQGEKYANNVFAITDALDEKVKKECVERYKNTKIVFVDDIKGIGENYVRVIKRQDEC